MAAACTLLSCSGLLKEENPTAITDVYSSEEMLEACVAGITTNHFFRQTFLERYGGASGMTTWGVTGESQYTKNDLTYSMKFTVLSTASENRNMFRGLYMIIQRSNLIIGNLADSPVSESFKREIEAECRFYRAMAYYNLVNPNDVKIIITLSLPYPISDFIE